MSASALPVAVPGAKAPTRMWAPLHEVEPAALNQLRNIAALPWVHGVAVMPDVHLGKGATVGSVVAMRDAVSPSAVGVDIGCGMQAVRTSLTLIPASFTLDHVWPQAFGGNSDPENLLPACGACNSRKGHAASWSLYPVQALVHGYRLSGDDLERLPKEARFAVLARSAAAEAKAKDASLRDAFITLGRPGLPTVLDESVSVDVFNLVANFS